MALSNMRAEPRREITETVIGILAMIGFVVGDWFLAMWFSVKLVGGRSASNMAEVMVFGPLVLATLLGVGAILAYLTHWLGEVVSAGLKMVGMDPRPKTRYEMVNKWYPELKDYKRERVVRR